MLPIYRECIYLLLSLVVLFILKNGVCRVRVMFGILIFQGPARLLYLM